MKESRNVESFNLDHTKVRAPYVRLAGKKTGPKGDIVSKFDIRFSQPNMEFMPTGAIHTLEHLMAEYIRDEIDSVIDLSPMGCRAVLAKVAGWPDDEAVPGVDPVMCGNWRDHDLSGAKLWAAKWVEGLNRKGWKCE